MPKGEGYKVDRMPGKISDSRLKDNTQASPVKGINTETEKQDLGRMQYKASDSRGYSKEAWEYKY